MFTSIFPGTTICGAGVFNWIGRILRITGKPKYMNKRTNPMRAIAAISSSGPFESLVGAALFTMVVIMI